MADERLNDKTVGKYLPALRAEMGRVVKNNEFLKEKIAKVKVEGMIFAANVLATAEVVGAAFGMGYARGYFGEKAVILGMPIDAATGLLLHGVAYGLGFAGGRTAKFVAANLHNLANGSLATWAASSGAALGIKKLEEVQQNTQQQPVPPAPPKTVTAGDMWAFGAQPQFPSTQMPWGPQALPQQTMNFNPWGATPQQGNPMTQEELAAAMAWQQAAA